jgi:serine/threonine protein phosphatase PrpC
MANCGDSRGVLIDKSGSVIYSTKDHKPDREDEKMRIESKFNGKVRRSGVEEEKGGPFRVWSHHIDLPGLAMSRSIGDIMAKELGVICDPEIQVIDIRKIHSVPHSLVLASDGVWDMLSS